MLGLQGTQAAWALAEEPLKQNETASHAATHWFPSLVATFMATTLATAAIALACHSRRRGGHRHLNHPACFSLLPNHPCPQWPQSLNSDPLHKEWPHSIRKAR